jgi:thioester reductase-like protein
VSAETAAKEYAYIPAAAPNSAFHRLRRLWRERVVPEWRERWNRNITGVTNHLTSMEVDVKQLTIKRAKTT